MIKAMSLLTAFSAIFSYSHLLSFVNLLVQGKPHCIHLAGHWKFSGSGNTWTIWPPLSWYMYAQLLTFGI